MRLRQALFGVLLVLPLLGKAQTSTNDAISREVSIFNFGQDSGHFEAFSREVSVFNFGQSAASLEAISREVSVLNFGESSSGYEAISREVSVFNLGQNSASQEAISREVSVFNFGQSGSSSGAEAISREVSVFNFGQVSAGSEAISREVSVFNLGQSSAHVEAISREVSVFNTIGFLSDLSPSILSVPAGATNGQLAQMVYCITNSASGYAFGPWLNQVFAAQDSTGAGARSMGTALFTNVIAPFSSINVTQALIPPANIFGTVYLGVLVDSGSNVPEITKTNNTAVSTTPTLIRGADLAVEQLGTPASAQFGQSVSVTFSVTNVGTATASANWNDEIYFSSFSNSLSGATPLATVAGTSPLPPGGGYTRSLNVSLPLAPNSAVGTYYLVVVADSANAQPETSKTNNLVANAIAITLPPLPDLVVGQVATPVSAGVGQSFAVSWSVTNIGAAPASGAWRESVFLVPASLAPGQFNTNPAAYSLVGVFPFTNTLPAGSFIARTQQITVSPTGVGGDWRAAVFVDSDNSLLEQNESNNTAIALNDINIPLALSLTLPVTNVLESTPTPLLASLVSRNGDLSSPVTVSLASTAAKHLLVPASVTIPAGASSAPFTATVLDDGVPGPDALVTISATSAGYLGATSQVTVVNTDMPGLTLALGSAQISQGQSVQATVGTTMGGLTQPVTVAIASSSATALTVPPSVVIPTNTASATFSISAVQNTVIAPAQVYTISATAPGYAGTATNLTVLNNNAPALSLFIDRTNIGERDGAFAAVGTVTRAPVSDQAITVALASTNLGAAVVPAKVSIPAFQSAASFYIAAINDTNITGPKTTEISAQTLDVLGNPAGSSTTTLLVVEDADGPALHVSIANNVVPKGTNPATTVTISIPAPQTNDLAVTLTSSDTNEISPPGATIPAGQTNGIVTVASLDDGLPFTSHTVTITASATNYNSGSDMITVTDSGLPDLVIRSISAPVASLAGQSLSIGFALVNQGLGALTNSVTQNVYLTTDPISGTYTLVGTASFSNPLSPGQNVIQTVVVPGNAVLTPGTYYVVVTADAGNTAAELNEANNTAAGPTPIVISTGYSATVIAGVATVPQGTPVPLTGSATLNAGGPATNVPVNILVTVRGLQRIISVTTDSKGTFGTVFNPLQNEAGIYTVSAVPPGITSAPAQAEFTILGLSSSPASQALTLTAGGSAQGNGNIINPGDAPLSGLTATVQGLAANLNANASLSTNVLPGGGSISLTVNVTAANADIQHSSFSVHVQSAEGAAMDVPVTVTVNPLVPQLAFTPPLLKASMLRGAQTILQFSVFNQGGAASGPLTVSLPSVPWLSLATTNPLPPLAPGSTNVVTLLLSAAADLPLGPYTGGLVIGDGQAIAQEPFEFDAVSDAHGALQIESQDEYTFFASGSPPLTNAAVTLTDPFSQQVVASGFTDSNGIFFAASLTEGTYQLDLTATQHTPFHGSAVVTAGQTNAIQAFLSRQAVTYTWVVVPTQIPDQTQITLQAEFEANVPEPVIVVTPSSLDLGSLDQPGKYMDVPLTIANHGLIGVQGVTLTLPSNPNYQFQVAATDLGSLGANSIVTVPMRITRLATPAAQPHDVADAFCTPLKVGYFYPCGIQDVTSGILIPEFNIVGCASLGLPPGGDYVAAGPSTNNPGPPETVPPGYSSVTNNSTCDQCLAKAVLECAIGFIPGAGCPYGAWSCGGNVTIQGQNPTTTENCIQGITSCVYVPTPVGIAVNGLSCIWSGLRCKCPGDLTNFQAAASVGTCMGNFLKNLGIRVAGSFTSSVSPQDQGLGLSLTDPMDVYAARSFPVLEFSEILAGDPDGHWLSSGSGSAFDAWLGAFAQSIQASSESGIFITPNELTNLLASPRPNTVSDADVKNAVSRWNLSITNWRANIFSPTNVPAGGATNFIDLYVLSEVMTSAGEQYQASQAAGYSSPMDGFFAALQNKESQLGHGGVCAQVVIQLDQTAVLTRDAFHATLQLNDSGSDPLTNVTVNLMIKNQQGVDVSSLFGVEAPVLSGGLSAVDGTGVLAGGGSGNAQWTLIPTLDAAPQTETNYFVSGTLSYTQDGNTVTIPLLSVAITVQPSPQLYLKYFLQRDVFGDDPNTPQIEPSIPFPLAVMVQNRGYGTAFNFQITSAQPQIVDNEKGLAINFNIIGTEVDGQPVSPSLTANFGDINPGQIKVADWLLTSSLQGLFINYSATYEHVDPLGNPRLSLIQGVEIHEMIHQVRAEGAWDDGLSDFLVNDIPDFNHLPDTLYLSDGTIQPVSVVQTGGVDAPPSANHLQVQFTATFPAGFAYILVPDPANGQYQLVGVLHANGSNFLADNFYTTDRTFIGLGQPPIDENMLHLFDYHTNAGPDTYTLIYASPTNSDKTPPTSTMLSLPAVSPLVFGVAWTGGDNAGGSGLAYYDIYVSDNGGPFTIWQSHVTATGALYTGVQGHTYAFYSVAMDNAGNQETAPLQPQAQTTVSLVNHPPTISVSSLVTIIAGQTLSLPVQASDPDPQNTLSFALAPGAPPGVVVNPATGQISWLTSPAQNRSTNLISVIATDNGQPPLSATGMVEVIVQTLVSPPVLAAIPNYEVNEGTLLTFTNSAIESNVPPRNLTFSLGAGAPGNASVDPLTGIFNWRPTPSQAPSTNLLTVVVTDDGNPPLSDSRQFTVIVDPVVFEFVVGFGFTNVLAGQTSSVPVFLQTSLALTNVSAVLQAPSDRLTNLIVAPVSPEVLAGFVQALGSNRYAVGFALNPALSPGVNRTLAQMNFTAVPQMHSAIVPLTASEAAGFQSDGTAAPKPGAYSGRVIVIGREPVLDAWLSSNSAPILAVYGHVGASYAIVSSTNVFGTNWQIIGRVPLTNTYELFGAAASGPQTYYRAYEFFAEPPILEFGAPQSTNIELLLYGRNGTNYLIQENSNLSLSNGWVGLTNLTFTNSFRFIDMGNPTNRTMFFRAIH